MKTDNSDKVKYYTRFCDMVENIAEDRQDSPAILWFSRGGEKHSVTYGKLRDDVRCLQSYFVEHNYSKKHIAILGENSYEWLLVYLAATYCGAVAVCVDIEQSEEAITQMIEMTDVDVLFYSPSIESIALSFACPDRAVFSLLGSKHSVSVEELIKSGAAIREGKTDNKLPDVSPDDTASIVFTSGTTSYSKPVMLSQKAILTNASDAWTSVEIGGVVFTSLPFYHTYGLTCSVIGELIGGVQVFINGNLKTMLRDLQLARPHSMLTVPLVLETFHSKLWMTAEENKSSDKLRMLLKWGKINRFLGTNFFGKKLEEIREQCIGSTRLVICGAAYLNPAITEDFANMGITVLQGYGITECSPLVSVNRIKANKFDSVGKTMPNCEVMIVDGEIRVRGSNVMNGYYKMPELTEESLNDGWFSTGDLGYLDKNGFLHITGRKKNLIVFRNGKKLSPEMFEEKIRKLPLVQDVFVYGATSGASTDDVQVAVSIYPDKEKTEGMSSYEILDILQEQINEINKDVPLYQQIQMINIREQEFSKTSLQKIKRHMV